MHGIVYAKGAEFVQSTNKIPEVFFPHRDLNIQPISACQVSNSPQFSAVNKDNLLGGHPVNQFDTATDPQTHIYQQKNLHTLTTTDA